MIAGWIAFHPDMMFGCRKRAFKLLPCPSAACIAGSEQRGCPGASAIFCSAEAMALWAKDFCVVTPLNAFSQSLL